MKIEYSTFCCAGGGSHSSGHSSAHSTSHATNLLLMPHGSNSVIHSRGDDDTVALICVGIFFVVLVAAIVLWLNWLDKDFDKPKGW